MINPNRHELNRLETRPRAVAWYQPTGASNAVFALSWWTILETRLYKKQAENVEKNHQHLNYQTEMVKMPHRIRPSD